MMRRFMKRVSKKAGLMPGTLDFVGERKVDKTRIRLIRYDDASLEERELEIADACAPSEDKPAVTWINMDGLHEVDMVEKIGERFGVHPLVLEDIVHTGQRPKMEEFEDYIFIVARMLSYDEEEKQFESEQFSLILGPNYVVTFQERVGDVFEPVRARLRKGKGRIRKMGSDYLAYALMDAVVDNYFVVLEKLNEKVEFVEEETVTNPSPELLQAIYELKRDLIFLRKSVWPLRELVGGLERGESDFIEEKTTVFLRDVYDHTIQVTETIDTLRDMVSGMMDIYLSAVSNRMNEVMKILTIIATIFIPMTFIAGIYGMNFKHMPELETRWGYPMFWVVVIAVGVVMLLYFKRKKWL